MIIKGVFLISTICPGLSIYLGFLKKNLHMRTTLHKKYITVLFPYSNDVLHYGNENLGGKCALIALKIMSKCKKYNTRFHFL